MPTKQSNFSIEEYTAKIAIIFLNLILEKCRQSNIEALFFLSRDATCFKHILEYLFEKDPDYLENYGHLQIHELALSREITIPLGLPEVNTDDWLKCLIKRYVTTFGHSENLVDFLKYFECQTINDDTSLNLEQISSKDWAKFITSKLHPAKTELIAAVTSRADTLVTYLKQYSVIGSGRVAFIDIGYKGTIANRVILELANKKSLRDLYHNTVIQQVFLVSKQGDDDKHTQNLPSPVSLLNQYNLPPILNLNYSWLECLYRDRSRGKLTGFYYSHNKKIIPNFEENADSNNQLSLASDTRVMSVLEENYNQVTHNLSDESISEFITNMTYPSLNTVQQLNQLSYTNENSRNHSNQLAKLLSTSDLTYSKLKNIIEQDYWLSGSLVLSNKGFLIKPFHLLLILVTLLNDLKKYKNRQQLIIN